MRAAALSLLVIAIGQGGTAIAAPPNITITNPLNGSVTNERTPSFGGLTDQAEGEVTLRVFKAGSPVQEMSTQLLGRGTWSLGPAEPLTDGTYIAQATQTNPALETGTSLAVTFTVDTAAPTVTLNAPPSPSEDTTPSFTGTASDTTAVTVQIHAGPTTKGALVSTATGTGTGAGWTSGPASPALASGQYTAVATQASSLPGNPTGRSAPVTFTVTPPPPPVPPVASFKWFPPVPVTGEPVTLVSSSTAGSSPITGLAWSLSGDGPFQAGGPTLTTSFSSPGAHVVRLRVTDARGLSSATAATVNVVNPTAALMQPFPVVRIAGTDTASGTKLTLIKVQQMPAGVLITVRCRGHRCPIKSIRRIAARNRRGVAPIEFQALERFLRAGVILEILVWKPGEIGKYTRLTIRRGKLPERLDTCLDPAGTKPLACPST